MSQALESLSPNGSVWQNYEQLNFCLHQFKQFVDSHRNHRDLWQLLCVEAPYVTPQFLLFGIAIALEEILYRKGQVFKKCYFFLKMLLLFLWIYGNPGR